MQQVGPDIGLGIVVLCKTSKKTDAMTLVAVNLTRKFGRDRKKYYTLKFFSANVHDFRGFLSRRNCQKAVAKKQSPLPGEHEDRN